MKRYFTDRSRTIDGFRCARLRYWSYEHDGRGIEPARKPLPLCVGSAVHSGLEHLLRHGGADWDANGTLTQPATLEDAAVAAALADFAEESAGGLELDLGETTAMAAPVPTLASSLVDSAFEFGLAVDTPELVALQEDVAGAGKRFDEYLRKEQSALVEGMVRAYARRRLRPLLEQFQVLEVEREGEWKLSEWDTCDECDQPFDKCACGDSCGTITGAPHSELWFMSRPDALLLERESRELYLLSYKTAASWDVRKAKDAQVDMQGLTEGVEVEQRLARWWADLNLEKLDSGAQVRIQFEFWQKEGNGRTRAMFDYLCQCPTAPRIHAVRMEYLLKGERWKDKELTDRMGFECRSQRSVLVKGYLNKGMTAGDAQWNAHYDYVKDDGSGSNLYYKNWKSTPVWEHMTVRAWIDLLDDSREEPTALSSPAWKSAAQVTGMLKEHPLDGVFVAPIVVYRNSDDLYDLVETLEAVEVRVAQSAEIVRAAKDEGERRHLLNTLFGQNRSACVYPGICKFWNLCYGSEEVRRSPLENGYKVRIPNHPQEGSVEGRTGVSELPSK